MSNQIYTVEYCTDCFFYAFALLSDSKDNALAGLDSWECTVTYKDGYNALACLAGILTEQIGDMFSLDSNSKAPPADSIISCYTNLYRFPGRASLVCQHPNSAKQAL